MQYRARLQDYYCLTIYLLARGLHDRISKFSALTPCNVLVQRKGKASAWLCFATITCASSRSLGGSLQHGPAQVSQLRLHHGTQLSCIIRRPCEPGAGRYRTRYSVMCALLGHALLMSHSAGERSMSMLPVKAQKRKGPLASRQGFTNYLPIG